MENVFFFHFSLGFEHIIHKDALDHLLFLLVICAIFTLKDWRKVLLLVTAFTIGHCITLFLAGTDLVRINSSLVELLIPATIILTAIINLVNINKDNVDSLRYGSTLIFGLIHGLGFSNTFRAMLFPDEKQDLVKQLLAFNIGIELAQIIVVLGILLVAYLAVNLAKLPMKYWTISLSIISTLFAISMIVERLPLS